MLALLTALALAPRVLVPAAATEVHRVAVDSTSVVRLESQGDEAKIVAVPLAGGADILLASGLRDAEHLAIDDTHVYFTERSGKKWYSLARVPKVGGTPKALVGKLDHPKAIAVDDQAAYVLTNGLVPKLLKVDVKTGKKTTLAKLSDYSVALAIDHDSVYWAQNASGEIYRIGKDGSGKALLADRQVVTNESGLASDGTDLYFTVISAGGRTRFDFDESEVRRMPRRGGKVTVVAGGYARPYAIVADASRVYWMSHGKDEIEIVGDGLGRCPCDCVETSAVPTSFRRRKPEKAELMTLRAGAPTLVAAGLTWPGVLALGPTDLVWVDGVDGRGHAGVAAQAR